MTVARFPFANRLVVSIASERAVSGSHDSTLMLTDREPRRRATSYLNNAMPALISTAHRFRFSQLQDRESRLAAGLRGLLALFRLLGTV